MSISVPAVLSSSLPQDAISAPNATFHPTIWGDHFLSLVSDSNNIDASMLQKHKELMEEMRSSLKVEMDEPSKHLCLIDAIQHLGVDYHFKDEIEIALNKLYHNFKIDNENDLNTTALWFRLLRQYGFHASSDVFKKFKDNEENFKQTLIDDVEGLLSLYEAAHLSIHGEDILDEAVTFTTTNLQSILLTDNVKPHVREKIKHALNRPIRKCLQRLEARYYIDVYSEERSYNTTLLKFAKLDFNILQRQHQNELKEITEWWKCFDVATRFPYARDRIVECYFWMVGVYFEPQYSLARKMVTKLIAIVSIMDDTYDNRATYEELKLLTKAIQRWDIGEMDTLPEYMKMLYTMLINTYKKFEEELEKEGRAFCVHYAREEMKKTVQAYNDEAKWKSESYVPKMEEYLRVSLVSSGYPLLETGSLVGMDSVATKEVFEWMSTTPKIVHATCIICRLTDDIVSREFEKKREHVATGVECYVKQYEIGEEEVVQLFRKEIANAWKDINEEFLQRPNHIPMPILERILNFARVIDVLYKDDDCYTNSHLVKHEVSSLFIDPVDFTLQ